MGHCEMLLAVAGLDQQQISKRTQLLAGDDWSSFSAAEQAAFAFARKQATAPWSINDADVGLLVQQLGERRALDVVWWCCRCHFMTRVADGCQLSLETENVFQRPPEQKP